MKISEVIEQLEKIRAAHGDLPLVAYDGELREFYPMAEVAYRATAVWRDGVGTRVSSVVEVKR